MLALFYFVRGSRTDSRELNHPIATGYLYGALLLLQRAYVKEGWLRWDSPEAKVIRGLFLARCREDPPEAYKDKWYCREWEWERRHRPRLPRHLEFVRHRHERTEYRARSGRP